MEVVTKVVPQDDHTLYLEFSDGKAGIYDVKPLLDLPVFRPLNNLEYFRKVFVALDTVVWPNEEDIAPETLYVGCREVKKSSAA